LRIIKSRKEIYPADNYYCPSELEARITEWVDYYNNQRYHEAIDNVTPGDRFYGKAISSLKGVSESFNDIQALMLVMINY